MNAIHLHAYCNQPIVWLHSFTFMLNLKKYFSRRNLILSRNSVWKPNSNFDDQACLFLSFISRGLYLHISRSEILIAHSPDTQHTQTRHSGYIHVLGCILSTILTICTPTNVIYSAVWMKIFLYEFLPEKILLMLQHVFSLHNNSVRFFNVRKSCSVLSNN